MLELSVLSVSRDERRLRLIIIVNQRRLIKGYLSELRCCFSSWNWIVVLLNLKAIRVLQELNEMLINVKHERWDDSWLLPLEFFYRTTRCLFCYEVKVIAHNLKVRWHRIAREPNRVHADEFQMNQVQVGHQAKNLTATLSLECFVDFVRRKGAHIVLGDALIIRRSIMVRIVVHWRLCDGNRRHPIRRRRAVSVAW